MAKRRALDASVASTVQAWHVGLFTALAFNGKLPNINAIVRKMTAPPQRQAQLHQADLEALSERLGVPIRKASPEALAALERLKARDAALG